jgi:hypothetical protein
VKRPSFPFFISIFLTIAYLTACSQLNLQVPPTPTSSDCAKGYTRLAQGTYARLKPDGPPNRLRAGPSTSGNVIGQVEPGTIVKVEVGPVCTDGLVFWKVIGYTDPAIKGWTAEGNRTAYWLEPYQP